VPSDGRTKETLDGPKPLTTDQTYQTTETLSSLLLGIDFAQLIFDELWVPRNVLQTK
jgi:hypothetical protein